MYPQLTDTKPNSDGTFTCQCCGRKCDPLWACCIKDRKYYCGSCRHRISKE